MDDESIRTQKEKSYIDDQTFNLFVDDSLDDKEYFQRLDQIAYAYELLRESEIVSSKSQFCGAIASMQKLLVPIGPRWRKIRRKFLSISSNIGRNR